MGTRPQSQGSGDWGQKIAPVRAERSHYPCSVGWREANPAPHKAACARGRGQCLAQPRPRTGSAPAPRAQPRVSCPHSLSRGQWMHTHTPAHLCCTSVATHPCVPGTRRDTAAGTGSRCSRCCQRVEGRAWHPLGEKRVPRGWQVRGGSRVSTGPATHPQGSPSGDR